MGGAIVERTFDPFELSFDDINARLSPGRAAKRLPENWVARRQPRPSLPIDSFIRGLVERKRAPTIRCPEELRDQHPLGGCPYAVARTGVAHAVFHAHYRTFVDEHRVAANSALRQFSANAAKVREMLSEMVGQISTILRAQERAFEAELAELPLLRESDRLLRAMLAVRALEKPFADLYQRRSQNEGNVWRIHFVSSLFGTWWQLTGCDPSTTGPFVEFLDDAWNSISDNTLPEISWDRAIRTAKDRLRTEFGDETPWRIAHRSASRPEAASSLSAG
jgi:hypothetical protein